MKILIHYYVQQRNRLKILNKNNSSINNKEFDYVVWCGVWPSIHTLIHPLLINFLWKKMWFIFDFEKNIPIFFIVVVVVVSKIPTSFSLSLNTYLYKQFVHLLDIYGTTWLNKAIVFFYFFIFVFRCQSIFQHKFSYFISFCVYHYDALEIFKSLSLIWFSFHTHTQTHYLCYNPFFSIL